MKTAFLILISIFLFSGCGITGGFAQNRGGTNINYNLNLSSAKFQGEVSAESSEFSLLCVIPTSGTLYKDAIEKLNKKANILRNSDNVLVNIRSDVTQRCFILWSSTTLVVSGDLYSVNFEKPKPKVNQRDKSSVKNDKNKINVSKICRKSFPALWLSLENQDYETLKKQVYDTAMNKPVPLRQEAYYFLGDIELLNGSKDKAIYYYKMGIEISSTGNELNFAGLKYHLQQLAVIFPDRKEELSKIYFEVGN